MKFDHPDSIRILGISGSLRKNASSTLILKKISEMLGEVAFEMYDGIGTLPHFNDADSTPQEVNLFREKIREADGVIICQPEYAFGVSGSLKNALDWTVGSGEFNGKPVALITAATGGENAHAAMTKTLQAIDCNLSDDTSLLISFVKSKINKEGKITDEKVATRLGLLAEAFLNNLTETRQNR